MLDKRKFYINGEWVSPSKNSDFNVINPATEEPYVTISLGNEDDTNKAVVAAKNAFTSWKNTSVEERITLLEKLLKIYKRRFNEMTQAISTELGAPLDWASSAQTASGESHIEDFILRLKKFQFPKFQFKSTKGSAQKYKEKICSFDFLHFWPQNRICWF